MSSRVPPILQGSPLGWFTTVHIPNAEFGEIDPFFVGQHYHVLGRRWNLYDPDGIPHQIFFNQSNINPLIIFGWPRLRNYYSWTGIIKLTFFFFGEDSFQLVIRDRPLSSLRHSFPPFHSLSTNAGEYRSFRMIMNLSNATSSKLVLPVNFSDFLCLCDFSNILLSGPLNHVVSCRLDIEFGYIVRVKFGRGWREFCQLNHIVQGNCLEFTCDGYMFTNVIIVELI
ncbi:hypothetical protein QL285_088408 [Trifolium repens]|nr:hypothetical protein QL285_088408 [Trifolium repens]